MNKKIETTCKNILKYWYVLVVLVCISSILAPWARAQSTEPFSITTNPQFFDITANPTDSISKTIRVRNNTSSSINLRVTLEKLTPDTHGQIILRNFATSDTYQSWLSLPQATISALPREWVNVPFTITIPKEAAFGYYWAILISSNPPSTQTGATTHLSGAVAIPVLLNVVSPGATINATLLSFQTSSPWYEYLPVDFLTTFQNTGNVHIRPSGTIFISDWLNNQVAKLSFNQNAGALLPHATRTFDTSWNDSFITYDPKMEDGTPVVDKNGKTQMQIHFHFDKVLSLRMGKYTATEITVVSGSTKDLTYEHTSTFFVFPWKILGGLLLVILLAGVGLWSTLSNIYKHGRKILHNS